ncbi:MAG: hypothetical protein MJB57_02255 [Gemmatimonadetes bacterium]|nr:hypothetical protein [Gemmatimonadota bacterium]
MSGPPAALAITDIHSHVLPGVDDGARDLDEALEALRRLIADGVERVVATPHFRASLLERSTREAERLWRFDAAWDDLRGAVEEAGLPIEIERGCEFKLDSPTIDLSDARLRLADTSYVLVEFAAFQLPPFAGNQLLAVSEAGWKPVLAHPERYRGLSGALDRVEQWRADGVVLQVNARSLIGGYGTEAQRVALELLGRGWVSCLASDYHSRGEPDFGAVVELLGRMAEGPEADPAARGTAIERLLSENPRRILSDRDVASVPPLVVAAPTPQGRRKWFW